MCVYIIFILGDEKIELRLKKGYIRLLSFCVNFFYLKMNGIVMEISKFLIIICMFVCMCMYICVCVYSMMTSFL